MKFDYLLYIYYLMRRMYALILVVPLMALFAGAMWVPSHCEAIIKTPCPMLEKMDHKCMMAMTRSHKTDHRAKRKSTSCGHDKDAKKDGSGCMDCPLCYLVTFNPLIRFELMQPTVKIEYTVVSDNNLSDYYKQPWKPPSEPAVS